MAFVAANMNFPDPKGPAKPVKKSTETQMEELCLEVKFDKVIHQRMEEERKKMRRRERDLERLYHERLKTVQAELVEKFKNAAKEWHTQIKAATDAAVENKKALQRELQKNDLLQKQVQQAETRLQAVSSQLQEAASRLQQWSEFYQNAQSSAGGVPGSGWTKLYATMEQLNHAKRRITELELLLEKAADK